MPPADHTTSSRGPRPGITLIGIALFAFTLWIFLQQYLLKHSGVPVEARVIRTEAVRRKGGMAYNVEYEFEHSRKHYDGSGLVTEQTYYKLRPGDPIQVRCVPSDPAISETVEMSHNDAGMFLAATLGFPVSLALIFLPFFRKSEPLQPVELDLAPIKETRGPLPPIVEGMAFTVYPVLDMWRARKFYEEYLGLKEARNVRGEWVEYHLWDSCFAITTMGNGSLKPSAEAGGRIALEVSDVDAMVEQLRQKGIQIRVEPFSTNACRMAVILDTEGNALTLHKKTV